MKKLSDVNFVNEYKPGKKAYVELKNGKIADVINGNYFDKNVKLIIRGRRIEAMPGLEGEPAGIKADFVIDLKGKTVLPGLFNTHCHTTLASPSILPDFKDVRHFKTYAEKQVEKNMAECPAHGITNIRDAWAADLRKVRSLRERIQKNELPGPRIMQSVVVGPVGGYLTEKHGFFIKKARAMMGTPHIDYRLDYSGAIDFPINAGRQQVRDAVDRAVDERGAEVIKIGEQKMNMTNFKADATIMPLEQLTAIAEQAEKRNVKSTIHHVSAASFRRALKAGISSLAHMAGDKLLTDDDIAIFLSKECIVEPTMSVLYDTAYQIKGGPAFDDPFLELLTGFRNRVYENITEEYWIPEFKSGVRAFHNKAANGKMNLFGLLPMKKMFRSFASLCTVWAENLRILFENGARMSTSNDGGIPPCTPAMIQHETDLLHLFLNEASDKNIFSGADALEMATINGAICLGIEEDFGSIETGKVADLVITDGDPFRDHRAIGSRVAALFKDGKLIINNCGLQVL